MKLSLIAQKLQEIANLEDYEVESFELHADGLSVAKSELNTDSLAILRFTGRAGSCRISYIEPEHLDPNKCVHCGKDLSGIFYGAGDGRGQKFQCQECYERSQIDTSSKKVHS